MSEKYSPNAIPSEITRTIYVSYGIEGYSAGDITINDYARSSVNSDYIPLCEQEITIIIPPQDNIKDKVLDVLRQEKQNILAENHLRLQAVQDKIDNLLAIDCKPQLEEFPCL